MANDDNIHKLFSDRPADGLGPIDTASVIRRAKRRRLPAKVATGAAAVLVLGGVSVVGYQSLAAQAPTAETTALKSEDSRSTTDSAEIYAEPEPLRRYYASELSECAEPARTPALGDSWLDLSVDFPDAAIGTSSVEGVVTLTNNSDETVVGYTAASPSITLAQDGIVLWHSNGAMIAVAVEVDLEPGESMEYLATFSPVLCSSEEDFEQLGEKLPPLPSGDYDVSAAIDITIADGGVLLATGDSQTVTLR